VTLHLQQLAEQTYQLFGCQGIARVDFMMDKAKRPYIFRGQYYSWYDCHKSGTQGSGSYGSGFW